MCIGCEKCSFHTKKYDKDNKVWKIGMKNMIKI